MSEYSNFNLRNFIAEGKKAKKENVDEAGPGFAHDCAAHVVHETYGYGVCIAGQHTLVENAEGKHEVTHYDVYFKESGIQKNIPINELDVKSIEEHVHGKRKKNEYSEGEEDMDEADLNEAPATDILDLLQNPEALMIAATYGAGLFAAVKGGMSAMDYCEAKPDNKLCKMWKRFDKDFTSVKKTAREKGRGYEEGVEETKLTKEAAFKNEIKDILDS